MDPRDDAEKPTRGNSRRRSASRRNTSPKVPADDLQWLTDRVPARLVHTMDDYAKESGITRSDVVRNWLSTAAEAVRERDSLQPNP